MITLISRQTLLIINVVERMSTKNLKNKEIVLTKKKDRT